MSQNETLVRHFNEGKSLTVASALSQYGIYALSQRVGEINRDPKRYGIRIGAETVHTNGKRFARYWKVASIEMNKGGL